MGNSHSREGESRRRGPSRETSYRRPRYEGSDVPNSPTQRVHAVDDHLSYGAGGFCNICSVECESIVNHIDSHHKGLNPADFEAQVDRGPVRPQYGKDMHPRNSAFSRHNTMTPCGFDDRKVPLNRQESEESASSSASRSVTSSSTSHDASYSKENYPAGDYHTEEELAAGAWGSSGPSTPRQGPLQPEASFSGFQSPPRGDTARTFSQDFFQKFEGRNITPDLFENRPEGHSASQAARYQPAQNSAASSSTSASYPSTRSSISPPRQARLHHQSQVPAQPPEVPRNDRGRERARSRYFSPTPNSPRRSDSRRGSERAHARNYPPRTSENTTQRKEYRREPSRTRKSPQAQAEVSRTGRHDNISVRAQTMRRDDDLGSSRTEHRGEHSRVRMPQQGEARQPRSPVYDDAGVREQYSRGYENRGPSRTEQQREPSRNTRTSQHYEPAPSRSSFYDDFGAREQHTRDHYVNPPRDERRREPSRTRMPRQSEARPPRRTIGDEFDAREQYTRYDHGSPPRNERRREPSRIRMSQQAEYGPPRNTRYDDFGAGEQYRGRDGYPGHSRREPSPPRQRYARPPERVVFPGDETLFSGPYLRAMGDLRFGGSRGHGSCEEDVEHHDDYDSDNHMFSTGYLRDMTETRGWRGNP